MQVRIPTQTWRSVAEKCSSPWCVSRLSVLRIHLLTQFILAKRPPPPRRQATPPSWSSSDYAQNDGDDTRQAEEPEREPDEEEYDEYGQSHESDQPDQSDQSESDQSDQSEHEPEDGDGIHDADDQMDVNPDAGETNWIPPREYLGLFPNGFPTPYQD